MLSYGVGTVRAVSTNSTEAAAQRYLEVLAGPNARLRPDQSAAILIAVEARQRALVVQRTGFGKSAIYFIATKLRRETGAGPTLLVSPLLALMRDQVAAARRLGVRAVTINSTNVDDWAEIEARVAADDVDLVCISPERLNHPHFVRQVLPKLAGQLGLLVIDEAHCISDWGHDFRPDYRRIRDAIANLEPGTPVLATTATANERVCVDVADQLGADTKVLRGPLDRESLVLGVARFDSMAHRLAWIAEQIPQLDGTGIVYCLTVAQTELVAEYLQHEGIDAAAYSSETPTVDRAQLEAAFKQNELKALVATSALGMGVDKPDVAFVFHLGAPPSPIAYYQQVGRAGRAIDRSVAWLLPGDEDERIWEWFASVGMPLEPLVRRVLDTLSTVPMSVPSLERVVDLRRTRLDTLLKILDVDGAVARVDGGWIRTDQRWVYDRERVERIEAARRREADAMREYAATSACLMELLRRDLDDAAAAPCGRCQNCCSTPTPAIANPATLRRAVDALRRVDVVLTVRKLWARGLDAPTGNIAPNRRPEEGRALSRVGDAGWWPLVAETLASGEVSDALVAGIAAALKRWPWSNRPTWITYVPSHEPSSMMPEIAARIGALGQLPVRDVVSRVEVRPPQSELGNGPHKLRNVWGAFAVATTPAPPAGPVLLLDDTSDSGWTLTVVAAQLRGAGAESVLPFVLALGRRVGRVSAPIGPNGTSLGD